eukprot:CAMPEP_0170118188 /NCGR_PEP_ID=MMETSP0020_2-20130122/13542_1 /TAXON_ID=98059 /ORGANISM="Dinobryon sp., Strain UTEXLB2267" /LENGTH=83 /DNA_ID=CAMNT_0010347101 /DNA_START=502 /DNA_END=753 /DNA_ORIENTATION=+
MAAAVLFRPTLLWLRNINEKQLLIEKKDSKKPKLITREIVFFFFFVFFSFFFDGRHPLAQELQDRRGHPGGGGHEDLLRHSGQ